ncbi:MAG: hypothetical protein COT91_01350 [Candidatus Doudnabacteria bacterium CG10_big_fil_rev_8_21_14_0_10_41_10]|uniref:Uncharacterized protein n=1 Tax=Candidatus Doudnabacteria bacterium CG10_big_fil_rev_8_21_14_0_10_41_10 TaxID=1974551 RepID=A0A2H0VEC8_9BACT|nr:MAG: hypothetical protein COT91_01350 [Candidatus Doudnabacteria bacterium CG10_big_fil_rev_8_21_14_0_10_41_10]
MIYLIGGAPRCGKTTLAKTISKTLGIPWVASDTLEAIAMGYTSDKDFSKRFPKTIIRKKTKYSNDLMYNNYTSNQIVSVYIKQSQAVWKAIEMLVESELKEGRSYIIEGYHVHPQLVINLQKKYGKKNFQSIFLIKTNIDNILRNSVKYADRNDWFVKRTADKDTYKKIATMISEFGRYFNQQARKYNLKVFKMDVNFKTMLSKAKNCLVRGTT